MYAIVKTGGKQYRVEQGQSLLVERLPVSEGDSVSLAPLLYVDGSKVVDGDALSRVTVDARVVAHERGPKLRIVKFKPKRGYKRRTGHRQELTRLEVVGIKLAAARARRRSGAGGDEGEGPAPVPAEKRTRSKASTSEGRARAKPADSTEPAREEPADSTPKEDANGA